MMSVAPPAYLSYLPDLSNRSTLSQQSEVSLPLGFPSQLQSPLVWEPQDFEEDSGSRDSWLYELSVEQLREVDLALQHFQSLKQPIGFIDPSTFPLPTLGPVLRSVSRKIHFGCGFSVLSGLSVDQYSREEIVIIYAGVSSYVGVLRGRQDHQHEGRQADVVLAHVKDYNLPGYAGLASCTTEEIPFHTDVGDIVALMALSEPAAGGESLIASSWRIYNELAMSRPDVIQILADDWRIPNRNTGSMPLYTQRPLLFHQPSTTSEPERVLLQFSRRSFMIPSHETSPEAVHITEAQAEALDTLQLLAERFHMSHTLKRGQIQFLNNLSIIHARKGFADDRNHQRHLLRLWLRDPENAWQTPEVLCSKWQKLYDMSIGSNQVFPLEPSVRSVAMVAHTSAPERERS